MNNSSKDNNDNSNLNEFRVHKIIARRGFCSTRKAEELIKEKRVTIEDKIVGIGEKADINSEIKIDNKILKDESKKDATYLLYKPLGYECSRKSFKNINKTIFALLPNNQRLISVGRLDVKTSGLLIVTTNGKLAQEIIHPSFKIIKTYIIRIHAQLESQDEKLLQTKGILIEDTYSKFQSITFLGKKKGAFEYEVEIIEGKKHIVRKLFGECGYITKSLMRRKIGNLDLFKLNLKDAEYKEISEDNLKKIILK